MEIWVFSRFFWMKITNFTSDKNFQYIFMVLSRDVFHKYLLFNAHLNFNHFDKQIVEIGSLISWESITSSYFIGYVSAQIYNQKKSYIPACKIYNFYTNYMHVLSAHCVLQYTCISCTVCTMYHSIHAIAVISAYWMYEWLNYTIYILPMKPECQAQGYILRQSLIFRLIHDDSFSTGYIQQLYWQYYCTTYTYITLLSVLCTIIYIQ